MQENLSKGLKEQQNKIREENSQKQRTPGRKWRKNKPIMQFNFDQSQVLLISRVSNPPALSQSLAESYSNSLSMSQSHRGRRYEHMAPAHSIARTYVAPLKTDRLHKIYRSESPKKHMDDQELEFELTVRSFNNVDF